MDNALGKLHKYHQYDIKSSHSEKFSDQFNAIIRESRQMFRRRFINTPNTAWLKNNNIPDTSFEYEDIPGVDISMPIEQYEKLINQVESYHVMARAYTESTKLLEAYEQSACEEQVIRDRHPALKKVYERYLIMFNLMKHDHE